MMIHHQITQMIVQHMRIDFRSGYIRMSQQCLDHPQIRAIRQEMRGKGMADGVRGHNTCINTRMNGPVFDVLVKPVAR